ncbi:MAG: energy transducer TonB [Vicingaceae bacterium]
MKKTTSIIAFLTILIAGVTAFAFANNNDSNDTILDEKETTLTTKKLSDFGIDGGINIDYRTGKSTQFVNSKKNNKPELSYMVMRGSFGSNSILRTGKAITQEKLNNAKTIADIIENFPSNWISGYNSVTVSSSVNGKIVEEHGKDENLTVAQKELFNNASSILIIVQYQKENNSGEIQNRQMNVPFVVTPEKEAQFIGGYDRMIEYLKENSLAKIDAKGFAHLPQPTISFIVSKEGNVEKVTLKETSRDKEIDQLLIEVVKNMPQWNPAVNKNGEPIEQEFSLNIGQNGC